MNFTIAFSPCPNDTFIFDALINGKIDTEGMVFDVVMEDVQTLNQWAIEGKYAISKISYGVLPMLLNDYVLLNSGGALGKGVGPILIQKSKVKSERREQQLFSDCRQAIDTAVIAIPGEHTTAHLLFSLAYPDIVKKVYKVFYEIEEAVLTGEVDAGVIIHENRFTYEAKGLEKIIDLGEYWESATGCPVPLGGIVAKRSLPVEIIEKIDKLIRKSVEYAFANYPHIPQYTKDNAQEMDESVMRQHIDLYVNNYSIDMGEDGRKAVAKLLDFFNPYLLFNLR